MKFKLRTYLIILMGAIVLGLGSALTLWDLRASLHTSREYAQATAAEQAVVGVMAIEHILDDRKGFIKTISELLKNGTKETVAFDIFDHFWASYKRKFPHNGALKYATPSGSGFICHRDTNREIVEPGPGGAFTAANAETGERRQVPDMRLEPWYRDAAASNRGGVTELHPIFCPVDGKWRRGVTIFEPVTRKDGVLLGVLGFELSLDWYAEFARKALNRSVYDDRVILLEKRRDGTFNLIADTEIEPDTHDTMASDPPGGIIDALNHKDPVVAAATLALKNSSADFEATSPIHRTIRAAGTNRLATYLGPFPGNPPDWMACFLVNESELIHPALRQLGGHLATVATGLALAIAVAAWFSVRMVRPIEGVTKMAGRLERLEIEEPRPGSPTTILEVDDLRRAINKAMAGLASFIKYIPHELIREYMAGRRQARPGGTLREITISFIDIKGYSSVSENFDPAVLVAHLNRFLEEACESITTHKGTVDKFIGDSVMAFWNAPEDVAGHPGAACDAMLDCLERMDKAAAKWVAAGLPAWEPRIGVHTGEVIVGNIGSNARLNYTIIGDAVNLASRVEGLTRAYGARVLITEATRSKAGGRFLTRPVDMVAVKGKLEPVLLHELMAWACKASPTLRNLAMATGRAHAMLSARDFGAARRAYAAILDDHPADTLSKIMAARCEELEKSPPPPEWSGIFRHKAK